jgi:hypothetical protein
MMKEFTATVNNADGCSAIVSLYVDRQKNFSTIKADVFGKEMSLAVSCYDTDRLKELEKDQTSITNYSASASNCYPFRQVKMEAYKVDNILWMHWEEYWQGWFVRHSERFNLHMTHDESSKFLQYIIDGFTE